MCLLLYSWTSIRPMRLLTFGDGATETSYSSLHWTHNSLLAEELKEHRQKFDSAHVLKVRIERGKRPAPQSTKPAHPHPAIKRKVLAKSDSRTVTVDAKASANEAKTSKEETKKEEEVKKMVKSPAASEQQCSGHYELNELMTRVVDAELQDIMTKITQELSDTPPTEAECFIVDKLRNKAGMDLKNVLGLNITKRLLNVYNPFYVKVKFNGKPEKEKLREFLRKYNFTGFTRKSVNIFAAQVRSIDDFDRLCGEADVKCGNITVNVSPVYQFTVCPPNLKTNYKDILLEDIDTESINGDLEIKSADNIKKEKVDTPLDSNKRNQPMDTQQQLVKIQDEKQENVVNNSKVKAGQDNKSPVKTNEVKKPTQAVKPTPNTETTSKPGATKTVKTENKTKNLTEPNTNTTEEKSNKIVTPSKAAVTAKVAKMTPAKASVTKTGKVTQKLTKVAPKKSNKVEDDFDELDDHDILALMSEGIVLDECSGSDVEIA